MSNRRLLLSVAHPDDESFGIGGLVAKYVAQGVDVYLICATNGDVGTVKPEFLEGYNSIAERRMAELDCATEVLGFKQVFKFGYRDSGMMGSETSQDSACLWQAPQAEVIRRVVDVIREVKPHVIITFNKYGGYGHPDHIAIQRATTEAFAKAGDATYQDSALAPYRPQKLYYTGIAKRLMQYGVFMTRLRGKNPRKLGRNQDVDIVAILDNVEPIHAHINIRDYYAIWDRANACHASQLGGGSRAFPEWMRRRFAPWIGLTRIYPAPTNNRVDEIDVFAGVQFDEPTAVVT